MKFLSSSIIALTVVAPVLGHPTGKAAAKPNITDVDILQYALTLEHLEDKFYREGLANFTLTNFTDAGFNATFYNNLKEVSYDETTHVAFLTSALKAINATPVAECNYTFNVPDVKTFIATASILEGVGVSAYLGAAASIVDKTYLTAAASILTVESRHSAYLRAANKEIPFAQPFDTPLDFDQVYTLAAPFITSCPASNGMLPVKAFPMLAVDASTSNVTTNGTVMLDTVGYMEKSGPNCKYYAAWATVLGPVFTNATLGSNNASFTTTVPMGVHGQSYVLITGKEGCMTDDCVLAGPAIVEVTGGGAE